MGMLAQLVDLMPNAADCAACGFGVLMPLLGIVVASAVGRVSRWGRALVVAVFCVDVPLGMFVLPVVLDPVGMWAVLVLIPVAAVWLSVRYERPAAAEDPRRGFEVVRREE